MRTLALLSTALFGLSLLANEAAVAQSSASSSRLKVDVPSRRDRREDRRGFSGSVGITQTMGIEASAGTTTNLRGGLKYGFYKTYFTGIGLSYKRPYGEDDPNYNGWGDVSFSIGDRELYANRESKFNLSGELTYIMPISSRSQKSTLENAFQAGLSARKGFGRWFSTRVSSEVGRYFHEYDTVGSRTNAPYSWDNSLSFSVNFTESLSTSLGGSIKTSIDYEDEVRNSSKYNAGLSLEWDMIESLSLSAAVKSTKSASGGGDDDDEGSANLFDAATTSFSFGASYKF